MICLYVHCYSYVLIVRQTLTEALKAKGLERCHLLLTSLKHADAGRMRFFTVDAKVNKINDRRIAGEPEEVPETRQELPDRTKFLASLHTCF